MIAVKNGAKARVSVALTPELQNEVSARAKQNGISLNRAILQLLVLDSKPNVRRNSVSKKCCANTASAPTLGKQSAWAMSWVL